MLFLRGCLRKERFNTDGVIEKGCLGSSVIINPEVLIMEDSIFLIDNGLVRGCRSFEATV